MGPILQQLYHGDLCPRRDAWNESQDQCNEFVHWQERFGTLLNAQAPELTPQFKLMMDDLTQAYLTETEALFYHGFSLAAKLFTEALSHE